VDVTRSGWRKSSYSSGNGGNCVEAASLAVGLLVRDSKDPDGPALAIAPADWNTFTDQVKTGALDLT
jgi:Domain of unknown function (DUF397)